MEKIKKTKLMFEMKLMSFVSLTLGVIFPLDIWCTRSRLSWCS